MAGICTLSPDINTCPYYSPETEGCQKPEGECLFLEKLQTEPPRSERREKWFEKYHR